MMVILINKVIKKIIALLLAFIALSAIIVWILLITDILIVENFQLFLLMLMPLISAASVVAIWSLIVFKNQKKEEVKK